MSLHSRHTIVSKRLSRSKVEIDDMLHSLYEFFQGHVGVRIRYEICDLSREHDADVGYREV